MLLATNIINSLWSAINTPQRNTANEGKAPQTTDATTLPKSPTIVEEKTERYMTKERVATISAAKKLKKLKTQEKIEGDTKETKRQTITPTTRNLILIFDDGTDTGAMLGRLATGLLQQSAFIIVNQALWDQFKTAKAKDIFTAAPKTAAYNHTLRKAIGNQSCASLFFAPNAWDVYAAEGKDAKLQDLFYLFVPQQYVQSKLGNSKDDKELGLNLSTLTYIKDPLHLSTSQHTSKNNFAKGTVVANALAKTLCQSATGSWNIYCAGHGATGGRDTGAITGLSIPSFESLINFFNKNVSTNFFFYDTCFAGGQHLSVPFTTTSAPNNLTYPIVAGSIADATTAAPTAFLASNEESLYHSIKIPMVTLTQTTDTPTHFFSGTDFNTFFIGLEAFAQGQTGSLNLIHTLNAVGNFLTPDKKQLRFVENIPQICLPGTKWFQVMRLSKDLPIIHLTRTTIMAQNYGALRNQQTWEIDGTGGRFILLQAQNIAVPLIIDTDTKLIPLIHTIPFLQPKASPKDRKTPYSFAFTAPVITANGLFTILNALWFLPKQIRLTNTVMLIDTFVCTNDLTQQQQKTVSAERILRLEHVMLNINTDNVLHEPPQNRVVFCSNKKYFIVDMDKGANSLAQLDEKQVIQYQTMYKQQCERCTDTGIETLRQKVAASESNKLIDEAIKKIMATQATKDISIATNAKNDFLSTNAQKRSDALNIFQNLLATNTAATFPVITEAASLGMQSANREIQGQALALFQSLFSQGQGFGQALKIAQTNVSSTDATTRNYALSLFQVLVDKGYYYQEAANAACSCLKDNDATIQQGARWLLESLFDKGQGFKEAAATASLNITSENFSIRDSALDIFKALFTKQQGFSEAQRVIDQINKDNSLAHARNSASELQETLDNAQAQAKQEAAVATTTSQKPQ